jgi:phage tail tape-measure protein
LAGAAIGTMIMPGVGTAAGGLIGGVAGAFGGSELGEWAGKKLGGMWATKDSDTGKIVSKASQDHKEAVKQEAKAPVIVHAPTTNVQTGGNGSNAVNVLPLSSSPRQRESYFDRAMMGTFVM